MKFSRHQFSLQFRLIQTINVENSMARTKKCVAKIRTKQALELSSVVLKQNQFMSEQYFKHMALFHFFSFK